VLVRAGARKYNQANIFKVEDEKRDKARLFEEEKRKEQQQRECE
jgi:hypothetical protein